ncbi:hypothetical protein CRE_23508 [Caenorhabditis remanei]|uniref:Tyrosine-protein phosphatase domain-containing protein n=1 Tax=Caenorhabditis remanei TaxID=31234 RepID=E3MH36_CAERE|nr:hypothetical protein CRE_23508 [Caenorhabditis remanei]
MKIWLLLVAAISAYAIKDPPESNHLLDGGDNYPADALHLTSAAASFRRRFDRNAGGGDLATHVNYLQMMARITNGIHILKSGMDKSLNSDEFISEILHFGDVTPAEIIAIDSSTVQEAKSRLENLPEDIKPTKEAGEVELAFNWLNRILTAIDGVGDIRKWTADKENFKQEIGRLEQNGVNTSIVNDMYAGASYWVNNYDALTKKDASPAFFQISAIKFELAKIRTAVLKYDSVPIWSFKNFTSALDGISPVLKAAEGVGLFKNGSSAISMDADQELTYTTYLDSVTSKLNSTSEHFSHFHFISKMLAARKNKNLRRKLKTTPGFFHGVPDLTRLFVDVLDPWILKVIKTTRLKTALDHLIGISDPLEKIDSSLGEHSEEVKSLLDFLSSISTILIDIKNATPGVSQGHNCSTAVALKNIQSDSFNKLHETLKDIDEKLAKLKTKTDEVSTILKTPGIIQMCDDVIVIFNKTVDNTESIKEAVVNFKNYAKLKELNNFMKNINGRTFTIKTQAETIKEVATNATANMNALDDYQTKIEHYAEYFVCLQSKDKLKSVFKASDGLDRIRKWNNDKKYSGALTDGINTMNKVIGIKGDLETLQKSIGSLSDLKTKETDALKDFKDAPTISKNIGKAVQGLAEMSLALEKRADVENKFVDIKVVSDNKANVKDPGDLDSLNALTKLSGSLQEMYTSLNNFDKTVGSFVRSDTFANQSGIFEKAKQVSGVTDDFSRMSMAVGNLKQTAVGGDANKLKEIEDALKTMDSLDLNFAGFHKDFNESKKSLEELDVFFAGFFAKFQPISATVAPGQTQPILPGSPTVSIQRPWTSTQVGVNKDSNALVLSLSVTGGVLILTVIVVLVHVCLHVWCRKWLVYHYCIKWKATPEMLFDMFYAYVNNQFVSVGNYYRIPEDNYGQITYRMYVDLRDLAVTRFSTSHDIKQVASIEKSDCRDKIILLEKGKTVLKKWEGRFANSFFHGNEVNMPDGMKCILTEGPQKRSVGKNSTLEKLFWLAKNHRTQSIVMLCKLKDNGIVQCDRYYPEKEGETLDLDRLTVKCSKLESKFDKTLIIRTLVVKFDTEKEFSLTHYALRDWAIGGYPSMDSLLFLHECLEKDKSRAIIHCDDGCERTGQFVLGILFYQKLKKNQTLNFEENFLIIKKARFDSIFRSKEFAFAARFCLEIVATRAKLNDEQKEQYEKLKCGWEDIENGQEQDKKRLS